MGTKDLLQLYETDGVIQTLASQVKKEQPYTLHIKGLAGSLDAIVASTLFKSNRFNHLFVMHDKEEVGYFKNDVQNLLDTEVRIFPSSYKKPYQFEEIENANVLQRAEILSEINQQNTQGALIITYPEALTEKVINKRSLRKNTFTAKVGDQLNLSKVVEFLNSYDFENVDFVYEAGQYAIRGGIVDVFSFAHKLPYRVELLGNEIESIRTFEPISQLSVQPRDQIHLVANVQTKIWEDKRQSFLDFLPPDTILWFKDLGHTRDLLDQYFERCFNSFEKIKTEIGGSLLNKPEDLFETGKHFFKKVSSFVAIEFGHKFYLPANMKIDYQAQPQPSFNKNFKILAKELHQGQIQHRQNIITSDSERQIERLRTIFDEIEPDISFQSLPVSLHQGFIDQNLNLAIYTDHQIFDRFHRYKGSAKYTQSKALTLKELKTINPGDYVVHIDYGVGRFAGLDKIEVKGRDQEVLRIIYKDDDLLYLNVHALHKISKYSGKEGIPPSINKLGSQEWEQKKKRVKKKVKEIAIDLIGLYAKRKAAPGFAFSPDNYLQAELESSFIYEDTPDQASAISDVKKDMEQPHPMDRLVCGDVGFGKTEIAIRAAFKAVLDGRQVAILVPTTILAMQHHRTFSERLSDFPVDIEYISRFKSSKQIKLTLEKLARGKVDILIGTHRLLNKDVQFKNLGLLVIDEEQKFGVAAKEKLKELKFEVDSMTLTATPIPRTLHFSLLGARDLSIISTPPPNRQPVTTEIHTFNQEIIRDAIRLELQRGGQVFFIHNRIKDIDEIANIVHNLVPDAKIGVAHGQMGGSKLEKSMMKFIEGEYDILVSTNIVESGLDIPNANTMIINHAHMFGLSDLHQMRGRVGRSNKKAFCYLLSPPTIGLSAEARKRLNTLEEFSELGDGFKVAMRDLDIRGAGNLLGGEQSGFINDLGFEMYHKILDEAILELKEDEFKNLFKTDLYQQVKTLVRDCVIETDMEILIPESYVSNISERLSLYTQFDNLDDQEALNQFMDTLKDRFGPIPAEVMDLAQTVRLRWLAKNLGFERLMLKNQNMKCHLVPSDSAEYYNSEIFGQVLQFVQKHPHRCRMREVKNRLVLTIQEVETVEEAMNLLAGVSEGTFTLSSKY